VSSSPTLLSSITLAITLTALLLVSLPVITAFSPLPLPIVWKVGLASASSSSSSENGGDEESNTDATTTDDTEGQHQQVPPPQQHQQVPGTTTSPHSGSGTTTTTPLIPDDDSTETPSTGTTTTDETPPDSEDTPSDTISPQSPPTDTSSQQGGQQPSSGLPLPTPFNAVPPQSPPSTTTSQGEGQQQGQGQQQQPPQQQVPGTTSPDSTGRTITFPGRISITKNPDGSVYAEIPDKGVSIFSGSSGGVQSIDHPGGQLYRGSDGGAGALLNNDEAGIAPYMDSLQLRPDGTGVVIDPRDGTDIAVKGDSTLTINKPVIDPNTGVMTEGAGIATTYSPDGTAVVTTKPDGTPTSAKIGSVIGSVNSGTTIFPDGISITKNPSGRVYTEIHDKGVTIRSGSSSGVDLVDHRDGQLSRGSDGSVTALFPNKDSLTILPDGTGKVHLRDDDTVITSKGGTLTISKPVIDPNTGVRTGESITTYTPPP
jgi:hypothetical protein